MLRTLFGPRFLCVKNAGFTKMSCLWSKDTGTASGNRISYGMYGLALQIYGKMLTTAFRLMTVFFPNF
jgi:hypothetical protein